jgi:hypothetical protein
LRIKLVVNAENAALKSDKFRIPNNKARLGLLSSHIETGLSFTRPQIVRSASTNRLLSSSQRYNKSAPLKKNGNAVNKDDEDNSTGFLKRRPKSVNNNKSTHHQNNGSRLLREAILDEEKRRVVGMASTEIPPMPTVSRSTLLQDFKKGFTRKKSVNNGTTLSPTQEQKKLLRKTSQLKFSSIPENSAIKTSPGSSDQKKTIGKYCNYEASNSIKS